MVNLKRHSLLLSGLFYTLQLWGQYQPLAVENAHWRIHVDDVETLWEDLKYEYLCRGDTIVEEEAYKKIYRRDFVYEEEPFPGRYPLPYRIARENLFGLIREDTVAKKVWAIVFAESAECPVKEPFLLFDFGVEPGDTLRTCVFLDAQPTVVGIDQYDYNGWGERTVIEYTDGTLLEGIGSTFGLFEVAMPNISGYQVSLINYCIGSDEACNILTTNTSSHVMAPAFFRVYPNPVVDRAVVQSKHPIANVKLFDPNGRALLEKRPGSNQAVLDLSRLPAGLYLLEVRTQDGQYARRKVLK